METNFQKIKFLIQKSDTSLVDQEDLLLLFAKAKDEDMVSVLKLFTEDPSWIPKINENHKAKQAALIMGDSALWDRIVKEEERQLGELERK